MKVHLRIEYLLLIGILNWVINPFSSAEEAGVVKEELMELQNDIELKPMFKKSYQDLWLQKEIADCYPALWTVVRKLPVAF